MPLYDLACLKCDATEERFIALSDFGKPLPTCACGGERYRKISPLHVVSDIQPYQAMGVDVATGKAPMITSRSEHRDYLKRNNYVEIGNENPVPKRSETISDKEIGKDLKKTIEQKGIRL